jgi:hypothetical protein
VVVGGIDPGAYGADGGEPVHAGREAR